MIWCCTKPPDQTSINDDDDWAAVDSSTEAGAKVILYEGYYYDVTKFIQKHPGGREIMDYFTKPGEDATIAIQQFHGRTIGKVHGIMKTLKRRPATESSGNFENQETKKKNKALTEDFTKLYLELKAEGLFEPSYIHMAYRFTEMLVFAIFGCFLITQYENMWIKLFGCCMLSTGMARASFVMHEAGHISLTGSPKVDRLIQTFLSGLMFGWSGIFWRRHHSLHHAMTQRRGRDVDLELFPIFLVNMDILDDPIKGQTFLLRNQMILAPFIGIFVLVYVLFWETGRCLTKYRIWYEFLAVGAHYAVAYQIGIWYCALSYVMVAAYLVLNFGLSHFHLPVIDKPTHWVEYALVHTADVEQRPWCDWWMGYLNYQIEHHLFPTMPQFRNREAVERVRALAKKHGLPYYVFSYREAMVKMMKNIFEVTQKLSRN